MATAGVSDARRREIVALLERLHRHKDAAYGDAWRKRGEVIAIFANMARKYDRLLVAFNEQVPAATEPLGDTVADLCVYSGKYLTWIAEEHPEGVRAAGLPLPEPARVSAARGPGALASVFDRVLAAPNDPPADVAAAWQRVRGSFDALDLGLMAQAGAAPAGATLPYPAKAQLAWALVQDTLWLLVRLEAEQPDTLDRIRAEVAHMDAAAGDP